MSTRTRTTGTQPHIVISTKELQDIDTLEEFFNTQKGCLNYVISVEYGQNGHPHLESFSAWDKELRQDKLKAKILKLYNITDYHGKLNTKVVFNHIDPDPMYGYGYSMKEAPTEFRTNMDGDYLQKCLEYYNDHQEAVNNAKKQQAKDHAKVQVNQIVDDFIDWLETERIYHLYERRNSDGHIMVDNFKDKYRLFYSIYPKRISYTEYSKIRVESVTDYINMELTKRGTSLLTVPPPTPP